MDPIGSSPTDTTVYTAPEPTAIDQVNQAIDQGVGWLGDKISDGIDWLGDKAGQAADWVNDNRGIIHEGGECLDAALDGKPGKAFDECSDFGDKLGEKLFGDGAGYE
jgi:hypothetical protein